MRKNSISVFDYSDYRQFLKDKIAEKKGSFPAFSNQYLAKKIGIRSRNFLPLVLKGERNISNATILKIANAFGLPKGEIAFFETLVHFNQGKTLLEKRHNIEKLRQLSGSKLALKNIPFDHYEFYSKWYHSAIWSLLDIYQFDGNFQWLAKQLHPPITTKEARASVRLLEKLKLIKKFNQGRYQVTDKLISTGDEVKRLALHSFYDTMLELAKNSMTADPTSIRNISGVTIGISKETYQAVIKEVNSFRKKILRLAEKDSLPTNVYQMSVQFFPLAKEKNASITKTN